MDKTTIEATKETIETSRRRLNNLDNFNKGKLISIALGVSIDSKEEQNSKNSQKNRLGIDIRKLRMLDRRPMPRQFELMTLALANRIYRLLDKCRK
jgi:hypothetical protein